MLNLTYRRWGYLGIAVQSAHSLGLHVDPKTHATLFVDDGRLRQDLWKSLSILACFCSTSLGRPMAIMNDDSSVGLEMPDAGLDFPGRTHGLDPDEADTHAVDGVLRSCHMIGVITRKLYTNKRDKISTATARTVASKYMSTANWKEKLRQSYELWCRASEQGQPNATAYGNAVLHVHLFHLHATILFTRPFFLHKVHAAKKKSVSRVEGPTISGDFRLDRLVEDCVRASFHTIHLVQRVREAQGLPWRNPCVL